MRPRTVVVLVAVLLFASLSVLSNNIVGVRATMAPTLTQGHCYHCPIVIYPTAQKWKVGVKNIDTVDTIYAQVIITGIGSLGDTFQVSSVVLGGIMPNHAANNNYVTFQETASMRGETFTFTMDIQWGLSSSALTNDAPQSCGPSFACDASSFTVQ